MNSILGFLFLLGLTLTGSDGNWFPWLNLTGVVMVAVALCVIGKLNFGVVQ